MNVVIIVKNIRTNLVYRGLVAASAITTLAAVVAAGKKW
jgi:predicted methyltransferase MtxX (methanogen marker protein 4)